VIFYFLIPKFGISILKRRFKMIEVQDDFQFFNAHLPHIYSL
jgi:hypothetical protein